MILINSRFSDAIIPPRWDLLRIVTSCFVKLLFLLKCVVAELVEGAVLTFGCLSGLMERDVGIEYFFQ